MIYTASGKRLKRAAGFIGGLVQSPTESSSGKAASAVASKSVTPVRRNYARRIPPVVSRGEK
jgi:hypothetical protein